MITVQPLFRHVGCQPYTCVWMEASFNGAIEHLRIDSSCFIPCRMWNLVSVNSMLFNFLLSYNHQSIIGIRIPIPEPNLFVKSFQGNSVLHLLSSCQSPSQTLGIPLLCLAFAGNGLKMSYISNRILSFNDSFYTLIFIFEVDVAKSFGILVKRLMTTISMS